MNNKFFQLPKERQQKIINAAYKVFSQTSYKKAPMSEIADECEISKALLFHYFLNKKELYMFLWNNVLEQNHRVAVEYDVTGTTDFFEILERSLLAKCSLMRVSPYLSSFAMQAYYEQDYEIKQSIQASFRMVENQSKDIFWASVNTSNFKSDIDLRLLYKELLWVSDGYLREMLLSGMLNPDKMEQDFRRLIEQWKKVYLK